MDPMKEFTLGMWGEEPRVYFNHREEFETVVIPMIMALYDKCVELNIPINIRSTPVHREQGYDSSTTTYMGNEPGMVTPDMLVFNTLESVTPATIAIVEEIMLTWKEKILRERNEDRLEA